MDTIMLALHVLGAIVLVGPQVLLFFAVAPATWLIEDEALRRAVLRVVTSRFAALTVASFVVLVVTGLYMYTTDTFVPPDIRTNMNGYRFGPVFTAKMILVVLLVVMIAVHGAVFGRRVRETSEAVERGEAEPGTLEAARRSSLLFSAFMLLVSIIIVFAGVTLTNHAYSHEPM